MSRRTSCVDIMEFEGDILGFQIVGDAQNRRHADPTRQQNRPLRTAGNTKPVPGKPDLQGVAFIHLAACSALEPAPAVSASFQHANSHNGCVPRNCYTESIGAPIRPELSHREQKPAEKRSSPHPDRPIQMRPYCGPHWSFSPRYRAESVVYHTILSQDTSELAPACKRHT